MTTFVPRYHEIEQALRARIADLDAHAPLPSDAQLCEEFGVSRMTARGAVQRLVHEGLVYRVPGRGTFVAPARANRTASHILSFSDEMRRRGRTPSSQVLQKRRRPATAAERDRLGADEVIVLRRVRLADGEPVAVETAVFPAMRVAAVLDANVEGASLFATLAEAGLVRRRRRGRETRYRLTPEPMADASAWMASVGAEWVDRLDALRAHLAQEDRPV